MFSKFNVMASPGTVFIFTTGSSYLVVCHTVVCWRLDIFSNVMWQSGHPTFSFPGAYCCCYFISGFYELSLQSQYTLSQLATEVPAQLGAQLVPDGDDLRCIGPVNLSLYRQALWACQNTPSVVWQAVYSSAFPFISCLCRVSQSGRGERLGPTLACSGHAGPFANGWASKKEGLFILLWAAHSPAFPSDQFLIGFSYIQFLPQLQSSYDWQFLKWFFKIFLFLLWKFCKYNVLLYAMYLNHISPPLPNSVPLQGRSQYISQMIPGPLFKCLIY